MAALRREMHEAHRIGAHYGPRFANEVARLLAAALFVAAFVGVAIGLIP